MAEQRHTSGIGRIVACLPVAAVLGLFAFDANALNQDDNGIDYVLIHPPFDQTYTCSEHWDGQLPYLGDSLGTDCTIGNLVEEDGRTWMREYKGSGLENHDWYGYGADVLAPCDCTVAKIRLNPEENLPGELGKPPASSITFSRPDKTLILIAHVKDIRVAEGDRVRAGEVVASVGNNGYSRQPHVHIGAWHGEVALQIRFDQKRMKPTGRKLTVKVAEGSDTEDAARAQLIRLVDQFDLDQWLFTDTVLIDGNQRIPHSHPVLTLNSRYLDQDLNQLATFLHEQFHWYAGTRHDRVDAAITDFKVLFPDVPSGSSGARDEYSTYLHLIICDLEFAAMRRLVGEAKARRVLGQWQHYTWVYDQVLNNSAVRTINERHDLELP